MKTTPFWPFLLLVELIAFTEGPLNPFWVWNAIPVALGYALLRRARRRAFRVAPEIAFIVLSCGLLLFAHAAWAFDWGRTATGSSTSALIFIFLPIYAIVLGGLAFGLLRLFTRREVS
jgi:hypothetical protein